ncbi:MAG: type transport system permease protein [Acidobacteriota bacterium]|jgi:ABC-2 type transport system permease protein|nr:type transport system permease protein [Acidobacteriota bacterium]
MLATVIGTELLKLRRSKITWLTWLAFSLAPGVGGLFMWILKEPDRARALGLLGTKARLSGGSADWPSFAAVLAQMTGVGGMVLTAVIATYVFGREYSDGTAKNMLALPVRRESFVFAKLFVVALWFAVLVTANFVEGVAIGLALDLPGFSPELLGRAARDVALSAAMCGLLVPPVAWIATLGRGYLPPLGFAIVTFVLGNVFAATGWGKWFPYAIVPLYTGIAGPRVSMLEPGSYVVVLLVFAAGVTATVWQVRSADDTQ